MIDQLSDPGSDFFPRLVALDIDGTLIDWVKGLGQFQEHVSTTVREAVRTAHEAGAHVVLASGRSAEAMAPVARLLGLPTNGDRSWIVASNGSVICQDPPLQVIHEETFDARDAVYAVLEHHPEACVAVEERGLGYRVNRHFPDGELSGEMIVTSLEQMVSDPVSRVIIRDPNATAEEFIALGAQLGLHGSEYVVGWTAWLDLSPFGISKASGLDYVCTQLGLAASDVLAIGDGRNDITMLQWAGRGVAMGQAVDDVKLAADHVTDSVMNNGVASELHRWFPPRSQ